MLNGTAGVLMTMFLRLHIRLALSNKTTIENLEMKGRPYTSLYDIGPKRNWEQIFGMNIFCEVTGQEVASMQNTNV